METPRTMSRRWPMPRLAFSRSSGTAGPRGDDGRSLRFSSLILPHLDAAWKYARYLTRDADQAEDVVQEAFLRAFKAQDSCRGDGKAWLLTIVRNCWHDGLKVHRQPAAAADAWPEPVDDDTPHSLLERQQATVGLRQVLKRLPEPFRETLVLRELEDLGYRDIANVTGVPIGTVMSRLARGREMLAKLVLGDGDDEGKGAIRA